MKKLRKYASFFEWCDKQRKELGIAEELIKALAMQGYHLRDPRIHDPDPPDCTCRDASGNLIALELVEFVSQEAVERNAKGDDVYCRWEPEDIRSHVTMLLLSKDTKNFSGGPYSDIAVVIHTDEPVLTIEMAREALDGITFGPFYQLSRAFFIFSYMPNKDYEVIQLSVATPRNKYDNF
jgi:hypothetical protein